jgi:cytochrome c biogenesis protein CcmG, thiol:disulfide interchange protein DsbE
VRATGAALGTFVVALGLVACSPDDPRVDATGPPPSPALLATDGARGLPSTVSALPITDVEAFRGLVADLRGTPVVVNLWASWCEPCEREMPMLSEAARERRDVQFLGVDTLDSRDGAEAFIERHAVPFPSLFDPDAAIRTELDAFGLPVTVFFDPEGNEVAKVQGELSQDVLDEHLSSIAG